MVLIRNDLALEAGAVNNKAVTLYPGTGVGCDAPEAFKKTALADFQLFTLKALEFTRFLKAKWDFTQCLCG